jgi:hypothetical protein
MVRYCFFRGSFRLIVCVSPGRFFAANEIKAMLCYLVMNYDVKLPGDAVEKPPNRYIGGSVIPSSADQILIRKRRD